MVDLPSIPTREPKVSAPTSMVTRGDVAEAAASPYVAFGKAMDQQASAFNQQARAFGTAAAVTEDVGNEVTGYAKRKAVEEGLTSVTRDADGNIQIEKPFIVGDAAIAWKNAMQTAAVVDGEQVIKEDMLKMRREFDGDPEGFRTASAKYSQEKLGQYTKAAGPIVGLTLSKLAGNTSREFYEGLLNKKERTDLARATSSIETQIKTTENELFAIATGGDTSSPDYTQRLQKIGTLWGQLTSNPKLGISRDRAEYEISNLQSQLEVAGLDRKIAEVQQERGPEAAAAEVERIRTDPSLNLTPAQRLTYSSRLMTGITQRDRAVEMVNKGIAKAIDSIGDDAAKGYPPRPEQLAAVRTAVTESRNPVLSGMLQAVEQAQPVIADWRKSSPQQLEHNLAELDQMMRTGGATPQLLALQKIGGDLLKNMRKGIENDPLGWANTTGAVPVPPIDFSKPDVSAQLQERAVRAELVANQYGIKTSYLRPDEVSMLQSVAAKGGDAMTGMANIMVQGFGDRAPAALSQISKDSPVLAHIGGLTSVAGSPSVIRDAADAVALKNNPDFKHPKWLASQSDTIQTAQHERTVDVYGTAFALAGDTGRAAEMTAQDAFFTRSARTGYDPKLENSDSKKTFDRTLQEAAGATYGPTGTQYGGVAEYKPGYWTNYKVLIPGNVRTDSFGTVMRALRDDDVMGAVAADGKKYSARDVQSAIPVAVRGGYRFSLGDPTSDDPKWIRGADGRPYVLDLERLEPVMRKRVPDAYNGGR